MLLITYFLIAIGVSFLCSILEAVLLSITPSHIEVVKSKNQKLGALMHHQNENIDFSIAAILTLNTFAHTLGAAGVGAEAAKLFGEQYMFYISAVLTLLILVLSEIIPKTLGAYYWKSLSGFTTRTIKMITFISYPLLIILKKITASITPKEKESFSKDELLATIEIAEKKGLLKESESDVIENLLTLKKIYVKDIYTPRKVVFSLQKELFLKSFKERKAMDFLKLKEFSRVPIYDKDIDDIVGVVISKEIFYEYIQDEYLDKSQLIKPVFHINENISISKVIDLFIQKKEHLFIVTDKYGQTEGIVTLEDAMETLLGVEIVDELDTKVDLREEAKNM
ncbi:MAG: transporter [Arcobacter sp.]|nr:MAG: transporter [Arcobacter sp.]